MKYDIYFSSDCNQEGFPGFSGKLSKLPLFDVSPFLKLSRWRCIFILQRELKDFGDSSKRKPKLVVTDPKYKLEATNKSHRYTS